MNAFYCIKADYLTINENNSLGDLCISVTEPPRENCNKDLEEIVGKERGWILTRELNPDKRVGKEHISGFPTLRKLFSVNSMKLKKASGVDRMSFLVPRKGGQSDEDSALGARPGLCRRVHPDSDSAIPAGFHGQVRVTGGSRGVSRALQSVSQYNSRFVGCQNK